MQDTQFMSAKEKERVAKQWETFLKYGCQRQHFTGPLYHHLIQHCSFIAHYDINGFYSTYFENGENTQHFLTQFDNRNGAPDSVEYGLKLWYLDGDYNDINAEMCRIASKYIDFLNKRAGFKQEQADIDKARQLQAKHGIPLNA